MSRVEWSIPALHDLQAAGDYTARDNQQAAAGMAERVQEAVEYLCDHPNIGRQGRLQGIRELVVSGTPFIIAYRFSKGTVQSCGFYTMPSGGHSLHPHSSVSKRLQQAQRPKGNL